MYILIDNTKDAELVFFYRLNTKWIQAVFPVKKNRVDILFRLDALLRKNKVKKPKGLAVFFGGAGFTSTRLLTTLANALSYAYDIPVVGVRELNLKKLDVFFSHKKKSDFYIIPQYSGEANIGRPKIKK